MIYFFINLANFIQVQKLAEYSLKVLQHKYHPELFQVSACSNLN